VILLRTACCADDALQFSMPMEESHEPDDEFQGVNEEGMQLKTADVPLPVLLITDNETNIRLPVMIDALRRYNKSYNLVYLNASGVAIDLVSATGQCRYSSIIFSNNLIIGRTAKRALDDFQRVCRAKKVIMYTTPNPGTGVVMSRYGPTNHTGNITFGNASHPFMADVRGSLNLLIEVSGVYCYPANIVDPSRATPAIHIRYNDSQETYTAGAFISLSKGNLQSLEIYLDSALWTPHAVILGNLIVNWISTSE